MAAVDAPAMAAAMSDQELLEHGALLGDEVRRWWSQQQQQQQQKQQHQLAKSQEADEDQQKTRHSNGGHGCGLLARTPSPQTTPRNAETLPLVALLGQLVALGQSWEVISR